jgi:DNA-binding MarR family transcriptional regulator
MSEFPAAGATTFAPTTSPTADQVVEPLLALFGLFKEHADACITGAGLTMPQAVALLRLDTPLSQRELADCLRYDASNITGIVDGLEQRGLVERQIDAADRRVRRIVVTTAGADVVAHLRECLFRDEPLVGALDADEVARLHELLTKAIDGRAATGWVEIFRPRR